MTHAHRNHTHCKLPPVRAVRARGHAHAHGALLHADRADGSARRRNAGGALWQPASGAIAADQKMVYFYAETNDNLSPHTGKNWMLLLIDADNNSKTGWYGYDFLINKNIPDDKTTTLMRRDSKSNTWKFAATLDYRYQGKALEIAVPRTLLGLRDYGFTFDFHWVDNPEDLIDPISLCTHGDSAPNRRFNYRCIWRP